MIPHFLVIGSHKSGTSWLDQNLRMHPEIWLPPEKEIHYFNLPKYIPFTAFVYSRSREARRWVFIRLKRAFRMAKADPKNAYWFFCYYFLPRTNHWYSSLFKPNAGQLAGEVTPHYAVMSEQNIAHVSKLRPDMKMIYLLRNPIDRMWSHAAMHYSEKYNHQGIGDIDEKEILKFLLKPANLAHAMYFENLMRWEKYFSKKQIFIGFFEELHEDPDSLLCETFQFLDINSSAEFISELSKKKIYMGHYPAIPQHIAYKLAETFIEDLEKIHHHLLSPYTAKWLAQCKLLLEERNK